MKGMRMNDKMIKMVGYGFVLFVVVTCCVEAMEDTEENEPENIVSEEISKEEILRRIEIELAFLKQFHTTIFDTMLSDGEEEKQLKALSENTENYKESLRQLRANFNIPEKKPLYDIDGEKVLVEELLSEEE